MPAVSYLAFSDLVFSILYTPAQVSRNKRSSLHFRYLTVSHLKSNFANFEQDRESEIVKKVKIRQAKEDKNRYYSRDQLGTGY